MLGGIRAAAELIGRSFPQVNEAMARLVEAGVLSQVTVGRRNRAFEAKEIINAFTDLERQPSAPSLLAGRGPVLTLKSGAGRGWLEDRARSR